ncbi:MAG: hypothetical protein RIS35_312 [Pseudomonadota bacterium]|jgi:leader peptidase (prepilin peptidase)/N-methyltransferase
MNEILELLRTSPTVAAACALLFGLCIGSFLNVVILRLPKMLEREWQQQAAELRGEEMPVHEPRFNLLTPGSHCPACGHRLRVWENLPLLGWMLVRGRCSACGVPITIRYPLVELLSGLLSAAAVLQFGVSMAALGAMILGFALIALAFIDLDTQLLPDDITLPLLWVGLGFNLFGIFTTLESAIIGAAAGYLALWSIYWIFRLATGREGMGYGDFKLLAALGAWFGWPSLPAIIVLSSAVGATVGITLILARRQARSVPIPFGPYLAGAGLLALYFAEPMSRQFGLI